MLYQRSHDIERRLQAVLTLIKTGSYSTPGLAKEVGVSIPTISRDLTALRERGHDIVAQQQGGVWRFIVRAKAAPDRSSVRRRKRKPR